MFAQARAPAEPGTEPALAALVGGNALLQRPPAAEPGPPAGTVAPTRTEPEKVRGLVKNQEFVVWAMVFAGVLLLAAVLFMVFDRWRKRPSGETAREESLTLSSFREMYENGELTEAEYERIKAKWAARMKAKPGVPAGAAPTPPSGPGGAPPEAPPPT